VKGSFLLSFVKFVDWPPQVFKGPGEPIAICVLGQNPFGTGLDRAARETMVAGRAVTVRQVSDRQQASQCQIVFMGAPSASIRGRGSMRFVAGAYLRSENPKVFWRTAESSISNWRETGFG
jgi:hypothetical protein